MGKIEEVGSSKFGSPPRQRVRGENFVGDVVVTVDLDLNGM